MLWEELKVWIVCLRPDICTGTRGTASLNELCLRTGPRDLISTKQPQVRDSIATDLTEQRGRS